MFPGTGFNPQIMGNPHMMGRPNMMGQPNTMGQMPQMNGFGFQAMPGQPGGQMWQQGMMQNSGMMATPNTAASNGDWGQQHQQIQQNERQMVQQMDKMREAQNKMRWGQPIQDNAQQMQQGGQHVALHQNQLLNQFHGMQNMTQQNQMHQVLNHY
jgi:hypothetical protein